MSRFVAWVAIMVVGAIACTEDKTASVPAPRTTSAGAPSPTHSTAVTPAASVHVESRFPGDVQIVNDTESPVRIKWDVPVEREASGAWTPTHSLTMMATCFAPPPSDACVTVAAHSAYALLPWTGWFGCTQCGVCRANAPAPPGRYRAVAVECDGGARHEGPAMTIVEDGRFAKTPHVHAAADDPSAIVIENEADEPVSFRMSVDVARLDSSGAYDTLQHAGMLLSPDCSPDAGADACVTIPAHGTLRSQSFRPGCGRCAKCDMHSEQPGTYLFTTQLCPGSKPFYNAVYGFTFRPPSFVVDARGNVKAGR